MNKDVLYFPLKLELDYCYSLGEMKPYFDALQEGRALASRCPVCECVNFPPRLICESDRQKSTWFELTGLGTIKQLTAGRSETFAHVAMDGAGNLFLGRLSGKNFKKGDRVKLIRDTRAVVRHPAQSISFERID